MTNRVFLSHSSLDGDVVRELCGALEARGIACWMAPRDLVPGAEWAAQIVDAIGRADVMLLVLSASADRSPQVVREVERASHRRLALLPVRIENVAPSNSLAYFLGASHWLDAHVGPISAHEASIARAITALRERVAAVPGADVATTAVAPAPAPAASWSPQALAALQALLAQQVGPIAGPLLRRAAAGARDFDALVDTLASEVDDDASRRAFVASGKRCRGLDG